MGISKLLWGRAAGGWGVCVCVCTREHHVQQKHRVVMCSKSTVSSCTAKAPCLSWGTATPQDSCSHNSKGVLASVLHMESIVHCLSWHLLRTRFHHFVPPALVLPLFFCLLDWAAFSPKCYGFCCCCWILRDASSLKRGGVFNLL